VSFGQRESCTCALLLLVPQKEWRWSVATNMLQDAESDENIMGQIITGDETWVHGYDPETKRQSSQWKSADSPRLKKARQVRSKVKIMLIIFFDMEEALFIMSTFHKVKMQTNSFIYKFRNF
jgi:hypothetical protein